MPSILTANVRVPVWVIVVGGVLCNFFAFNFYVENQNVSHHENDHFLQLEKSTTLDDETNVKIPHDLRGDQMSLQDRVRYLELKLNALTNFGTDPFFGVHIQQNICKKQSELDEFACKLGREGVVNEQQVQQNCGGLFDHMVCLDGLPEPGTKYEVTDGKPPCLVYDFGIRAQPQFGASMARDFGCEVHAFDPSPVSVEWWKSDEAKSLRDLPNYHFHPYGAGGIDGDITLKEYNWNQVSIIRYPSWEFNCEGEGDSCQTLYRESKSFKLPVKTLPTIIKELGHEGRTLDVLKVDVEGSEFAFLENLLDSTGGCPDFINQLTLEWHHFSWDWRYGEGSNPAMNAISTLLNTCGLKLFWVQ